MKKFLLPSAIAALALLPLQQSQAAKFGGFTVGYKFRLKVTSVTSIKLQGSKETKVPIPTEIPRYAKNDVIPFEIITKGAIRTRKFSIPFINGTETTNDYSKVIYGSKNDSLRIYKNTSSKAVAGSLVFVRNSGTTTKPAINKVTYTLEKP